MQRPWFIWTTVCLYQVWETQQLSKGIKETSGQRSLTKGRIACRAVIENWMIRLLRTPQQRLPMFFDGPDSPPQKLPHPVEGSRSHLIHGFLCPTDSSTFQSAYKYIASTVFARLTNVINRSTDKHTDRQTTLLCK